MLVSPAKNYNSPSDTIERVEVEFGPVELGDFIRYINELKCPVFVHENTHYVLLQNLVLLWNYPSSYQLIKHMVKKGSITKLDLLSTDSALNELLLENGVIDESMKSTKLFYLPVATVFGAIENKSVLVDNDEFSEAPRFDPISKKIVPESSLDDRIYVSQVFPQYGMVKASLPLTHATFNTLNKATKLNYYKLHHAERKMFGSSLTSSERELIFKENDHSELDGSADYDEISPSNSGSSKNDEERKSRRPIRVKKNITNVDPNTIDLTEASLPGQGLIQEFSVNHICKVPNYFITNNQMNAAQNSSVSTFKKPSSSAFTFNTSPKMSRNIQQLAINNDQESYHHSKYYYFKTYRGPGSGNYKDAALINRINKIYTSPGVPSSKRGNHKNLRRSKKIWTKRHNHNVKGLIHDDFSKENVDLLLSEQRRQVEDFHNIEMLHNNLQFNLLVNTYREVADETWDAYYHFKMTDFEQLHELQRIKLRDSKRKELIQKHQEAQTKAGTSIPPSQELTDLYKPQISDRFTLPNAYPEIMTKLPEDLRGDGSEVDVTNKGAVELIDSIPSVKRPLTYSATYTEYSNPEFVNKVEVLKLPNANSIGWDNFKKYRN